MSLVAGANGRPTRSVATRVSGLRPASVDTPGGRGFRGRRDHRTVDRTGADGHGHVRLDTGKRRGADVGVGADVSGRRHATRTGGGVGVDRPGPGDQRPARHRRGDARRPRREARWSCRRRAGRRSRSAHPPPKGRGFPETWHARAPARPQARPAGNHVRKRPATPEDPRGRQPEAAPRGRAPDAAGAAGACPGGTATDARTRRPVGGRRRIASWPGPAAPNPPAAPRRPATDPSSPAPAAPNPPAAPRRPATDPSSPAPAAPNPPAAPRRPARILLRLPRRHPTRRRPLGRRRGSPSSPAPAAPNPPAAPRQPATILLRLPRRHPPAGAPRRPADRSFFACPGGTRPARRRTAPSTGDGSFFACPGGTLSGAPPDGPRSPATDPLLRLPRRQPFRRAVGRPSGGLRLLRLLRLPRRHPVRRAVGGATALRGGSGIRRRPLGGARVPGGTLRALARFRVRVRVPSGRIALRARLVAPRRLLA